MVKVIQRIQSIIDLANRNLDRICDRPCVLWGGGPNVKFTYNILQEIEAEVVGFYDSRYDHLNEHIPCEILSKEQLDALRLDDINFIVVPGLNELYGDIVPQQLFYERIFHRRALDCSIFFQSALNVEKLKNCTEVLCDSLSVDQYLGRIERLLSGVMFDNRFQVEKEPYFNNSVIQHLSGNWFYAGLFNGRHFNRARKAFPKAKLQGAEPSEKMYALCQDMFSGDQHIKIHNRLLWDSDGESILFNDDSVHGGVAASVHNDSSFGASYPVQTSTIDSIIDSDITHLSLDVEGTEVRALLGAKQVLAQQLSHVSICTYHSHSDFVTIPLLLKSLHGGRISVRQHSALPFIENVCYSVKE